MADNNSWELISTLAGTSVTGNTSGVQLLDERITQANNALSWLKSHVDSQTTKSAIIRHNVPIDDLVEKGDLVYYNSDPNKCKYYKAQALLLPEATSGGKTLEAPEARVEGIIIDTYEGSSGVVGTMLCGGYWNDDAVTNACLTGTDTTAGIYYLSPTIPGKATKETGGHLRQPVLSYYGTSAGFSMSIFYMAHDNHFHASQALDGSWGRITGTDVPEGAQSVYTGDITMGLGTLGDTTAVFYKGVLQIPFNNYTTGEQFQIYKGKLYCMMANAPAAGDVVVFNHYPFAYENAIIRGVYSDSDSLTVENTNGIIKLTANDFVAGDIAPSAYAVSGIQDNTINFTPIVANVYAGPGIDIARSLDGGVFISSSALIGGLIDAYSINHNGTTLVSAGSLEYITFQTLRNSNFVMTAPVKGITVDCKVSVWAMRRGQGGPDLKVDFAFIPDPTSSTQVAIPVLEEQGLTLGFAAGTSTDSLVYGEVAVPETIIDSDGLLIARVSAVSPSTQIMLLRAGFKLSVDETAAQDTTIVDTSRSIRQTMAAGELLDAGDAVYVQNNLLFKCYNSIGSGNDTTNRCVGIVEVGATAGNNATYVLAGAMLLSNAPGQSGDSLFIGKNGHVRIITGEEGDTVDDFLDPNNSTTGQARYLQKIGTVLATNVIQVNVESAIRSAVQ